LGTFERSNCRHYAYKKIDKISVNGEQISDPSLIAEEFNSFFTNIGKTISDSVRPTSVDPIVLMPEYPNLMVLNLQKSAQTTYVES
jgi:hypothetical protein